MLIATQCQQCHSSLIRIKLFNKWDIDKSVIFGVACGVSLTFSTYLVYKLWKFNKNLNKSVDTIDRLTKRLDLISNDLSKINGSLENKSERPVYKKKSNISLKQDDTSAQLVDNKKSKQISSASSTASLSDYYETPLTSPQESSTSDDEDDDNDKEQFQDPIEDNTVDFVSKQPQLPLKSVLKNRKLDDNILPLLQQPLDYLRDLVRKNEDEFKKDERNVEKLIEYVKSLYSLAERTDGDYNFVKESHFKCRELAHKALDLNDQIYLTHKWRAITVGRVIEYLGIHDKVRASIEFKKHLDIAISLDENDYYMLYMRGRWAYGICNLNRVEKYAVKLIYGEMPSCKMENALEDFLKVEKLYPKKFKGNLLYLAKEQNEHQEIKALLDKYSNT